MAIMITIIATRDRTLTHSLSLYIYYYIHMYTWRGDEGTAILLLRRGSLHDWRAAAQSLFVSKMGIDRIRPSGSPEPRMGSCNVICYTIYYLLSTIYYILCTIYYMLCTLCSILYTLYYTLYSILYTLYSIRSYPKAQSGRPLSSIADFYFNVELTTRELAKYRGFLFPHWNEQSLTYNKLIRISTLDRNCGFLFQRRDNNSKTRSGRPLSGSSARRGPRSSDIYFIMETSNYICFFHFNVEAHICTILPALIGSFVC